MSSDEHEIDIEEHDVLSDPRLRHLLPNLLPAEAPDLARVKTEAPDYDEDPPDLGYQPFTTDFHQRAGPSVRQTHDHDTAEYTRHQNKIILGSKPTSRPKNIRGNSSGHQNVRGNFSGHQNAGSNLNVREVERNGESVLVFDRDLKIKQEVDVDFEEPPSNNSSVVGRIPSAPSRHEVPQNGVHNHRGQGNRNEENEEQIPENCRVSLEDWGPRLERSSCYCKDCEILFATRNALDAHKMACHSFLVAVDNRAVKSTAKVQNLKSCAQCNKKFANDSLLLAHVYGHLESKIADRNKEKGMPRPSIQPNFSNKISFGTRTQSLPEPNSDSESDNDNASGYFRCAICGYYARRIKSFYTHSIRNHHIMKPRAYRIVHDSNCKFCSYRNDNITLFNKHLYKNHNDIYSQKAETPSQPQPKMVEDTIVKFRCSICDAAFMQYFEAKLHRMKMHPELKSDRIINKIFKTQQKSVQNKLAEPSTSKRKADDVIDNPKRQKIEPRKKRLRIYFCDVCKTTFFAKNTISLHLEKKCKDYMEKVKYICKTCGLCHSVHCKHGPFHEKNPDITIHNLDFIRVQDNMSVPAPIPQYHSCKRCGVNLLRHLDIEKHACGAPCKTCKYCKKKFPDYIYTTHMEFHKYVIADQDVDKPQNVPEIPEILKKYHMLTETWNILYHCKVCDIATDSYDKAVEHSQKHFNNLENYDVVINPCEYCQLMFDESCLERHLDIHKANKSINKESFRVLSYDYSKLLSTEWLELFGSLPKSQIQQIVSRSIYAYCRSVKMTVFLDGAPELTLYQCGTCRRYVHPQWVPKHTRKVCLITTDKHYCNICHIPFCSISGKEVHQSTHENRGTYRHVIFNAPRDVEFDAALKTNDEEIPPENLSEWQEKNKFATHPLDRSKHHSRIGDGPTGVLYPIYNCTICNVHILKRENVKRHDCSKRRYKLKQCDKCGLNIPEKTMFFHTTTHDTNDKFVRQNMRNIKFTTKTNANGEKEVIYGKPTAFNNRVAYLPSETKEPRNNETDDFNNDMDVEEEGHDTNDGQDDGNDEPEKHKLYKCGSCNLLFHVKSDIVRHLPTCDPNANKENKCIKCGMSFYSTILTHMLKVTNCHQLTEDDYDIVTLYPREIELNKIIYRNKENWVYKCFKCDAHWMKTNSVYHHVTHGHNLGKVINCTKCGLKFPKLSFEKHKVYHHEILKLTRNDIYVNICRQFNPTATEQNKRPVQIKTKEIPKWTALTKKVAAKNMAQSNVCNTLKLYKCQTCPLYFLSSNSKYKHKAFGRCGKTKGKQCDRCEIVLGSEKALSSHYSIHHDRLNMNLNDVAAASETGLRPTLQTNNTVAVPKPLLIKKITKVPPSYNKKEYFSKTLYSCDKCPLMFMALTAFHSHFYTNNHKIQSYTCNICQYSFSYSSIKKHKYVHHQKMKLRREDFIVVQKHNLSTTDNEAIYDNELEIDHDESSQDHAESMEDDNELAEDHDQSTNDDESEARFQKVTSQRLLALDTSKYTNIVYKCKSCPLHFISIKSRGVHYRHHMWKDNNDMEGLVCPVCLITFNKNSLKAHIYVHHQTLKLGRKDIRVSRVNVPIEVSQPQPQPLTSRRIYTKPTKITNSIKAKIVISKYSRKLFPCQNCGRHLLTLSSYKSHLERANNGTSSDCMGSNDAMTCDKCGLLFGRVTLLKHVYIHHEKMKLKRKDLLIIRKQENQNKENVTNAVSYTLSEEHKAKLDRCQITNKLYRCYRCGLHFFQRKSRSLHIMNQCATKASSQNCVECGLAFSPRTLPKHFYVHHEKCHLQLKDLNIISDIPQSEDPAPMKANKQPQRFNKLSEAAQADIDLSHFDNTLYKCTRCGRHFINVITRRSHESKCLNKMARGETEKCSKCGFLFNKHILAKHIYIHHEKMNLMQEDFDIIKNFKSLSSKISRSSYEFDGTYSRRICPETRSLTSGSSDTKMEKNLRKRVADDMSDCSFDISRASSMHNLTADSDSRVDESVSEREEHVTSVGDKKQSYSYLSKASKKAIQISNYSNKLYRCTVCKAHFLLADSLVRHGDRVHYKLLENCDVCGHGFAPLSLPRHQYIHHERLTLTKDDIIIVSSEELYRTLYKCTKCLVHTVSGKHSCPTKDIQKCIICDLLFGSKSLNVHYEKHHKTLKLSLEDFIVVDTTYNTDGNIVEQIYQIETAKRDEALTSQHDSESSEIESSVNQQDECLHVKEPVSEETRDETIRNIEIQLNDEPDNLELSTLNPDLYDNKLYKCNQCSLHFLAKQNFEWHLRNSDHVSVIQIHCTICGLGFSAQTLPTHTFIHHEQLKLGVKDFIINDGSPDKDSNRDSDSNKDINEVIDSSNKNKDIDLNKSVSSKDKNKDIALNHKSVSSKGKKKDSDERVNDLNSTDDSVVSQSSDESFEEKNESSSPQKSSEPPQIINCYTEVYATKKYTTKLYKCGECQVHYLSQNSCYKHTYKNHIPLDPFDYIACKICGLQFSNMTLPKHVINHHKNKQFNLDKVLVEEYVPNKGPGAPKIEIYLAIDRVQSKLVSTTCEKELPECSTSNYKGTEIPESTTSVEEETLNKTSVEVGSSKTNSTEVESFKTIPTEVISCKTTSIDVDTSKSTLIEETLKTTSTEVESLKSTSMEVDTRTPPYMEVNTLAPPSMEVDTSKTTSADVESSKTTMDIDTLKSTPMEVESLETTSMEIDTLETTSIKLEPTENEDNSMVVEASSVETRETTPTIIAVVSMNAEASSKVVEVASMEVKKTSMEKNATLRSSEMTMFKVQDTMTTIKTEPEESTEITNETSMETEISEDSVKTGKTIAIKSEIPDCLTSIALGLKDGIKDLANIEKELNTEKNDSIKCTESTEKVAETLEMMESDTGMNEQSAEKIEETDTTEKIMEMIEEAIGTMEGGTVTGNVTESTDTTNITEMIEEAIETIEIVTATTEAKKKYTEKISETMGDVTKTAVKTETIGKVTETTEVTENIGKVTETTEAIETTVKHTETVEQVTETAETVTDNTTKEDKDVVKATEMTVKQENVAMENVEGTKEAETISKIDDTVMKTV